MYPSYSTALATRRPGRRSYPRLLVGRRQERLERLLPGGNAAPHLVPVQPIEHVAAELQSGLFG